MSAYKQICIVKMVFSIAVILNLSLYALTPRLLITLGPECDFSANALAQNIDARVIEGTESEMQMEIQETDLSDQTHVIVLATAVGDLSKFSANVFYDYICLNDIWEVSLTDLNEKIVSVPVTDADLKRISKEERGQFYHLMGQVSALFEEHRIPFWAISGTLLGAVRHSGMVPWDDDLDIIIRTQEKKQFEALAPLLNDMGLELFIYHNYYYKVFPKTGQLIYLNDGSTYPWKYPFIDVYVVNELEGKVRIVSHNYPSIDLFPAHEGEYRGWWLYPHEIKQPALHCPFGPMMMPVPHDFQEILKREYGPDWYSVAYMWHNHAAEIAYRRIKVAITDYSPPEYLLPQS